MPPVTSEHHALQHPEALRGSTSIVANSLSDDHQSMPPVTSEHHTLQHPEALRGSTSIVVNSLSVDRSFEHHDIEAHESMPLDQNSHGLDTRRLLSCTQM